MTALFALLLLAQAAAPAAAAPAADVLSLEAALQQAGTRNLDLQAARARLDQARETSRKLLSGYLPKISAGGGYTLNSQEAKIAMPTGNVIRDLGTDFVPEQPGGPDNLPGSPTTLIQVPTGFMEAVIQKKHQLGGQVELNQAIFAPSLIPAIRAASVGAKSAERSVEAARRDVLFAVAQVYFAAAGAREALEVQRTLLAGYEAHEKDAEVQVSTGAAPKMALLRAQIDRVRAEQDVRRAEYGYLGAKSQLAALLDREPDFEVTTPDEPPMPPESGNPEATALEARPEVEAARLGVKAAELGRSATRLSYAPTIGASARYQMANVSGFTGSNSTWLVTLGLNWTLWDGGLREAELREQGARLAEARLNERSTEVRIRDEVRRAQLDLETARANRVQAQEQARLARENETLVRSTFEAGVGTYLEATDAASSLRQAELGLIYETLNARLAVLRLARAVGEFKP